MGNYEKIIVSTFLLLSTASLMASSSLQDSNKSSETTKNEKLRLSCNYCKDRNDNSD